MTEFLRQTATIAAKDLRAEFRNKEVINAAFSFTLVVLLLFSFAFDPTSNPDVRGMAGGLLWLVYLFSGILVLNRSFARETANECLDALVASPVPGSAMFLGKCLANGVLLVTLELISLPIFGIFYDVNWLPAFGKLLLIFVLGTWAFRPSGRSSAPLPPTTACASYAAPAGFPDHPAGSDGLCALTTVALTGDATANAELWWRVLLVFDLVFSLLGAVLLKAFY